MKFDWSFLLFFVPMTIAGLVLVSITIHHAIKDIARGVAREEINRHFGESP